MRRIGPRRPAGLSAPDLDLGSAILQAAVVLLLFLAWSSAPGTASIAFIGVGTGAWLLLSAAAHRHPGRAAELRGVLTTIGTVASAGFLLRLGPDAGSAMREWGLFVAGTLTFFAAGELGARCTWSARGWWALTAPAVLAAIALVPARGPDGSRAASVFAYSAPLPVLALALAGLAAAAASRTRYSSTTQTWAVAFPPVAVFAYTRDPGALVLLGLPLLAVVTTAHLTVWRRPGSPSWRGPLTVGAAAILTWSLGAAALIGVQPGGGFSWIGPPARRDLFGVPLAGRDAGALLSGTTREVAGTAGVLALLVLVVVLAVQVLVLFGVAVRRTRREPGAVVVLCCAAIAAQLTVSLAGPIIAATGVRVPASLATLPLASDGAAFVVMLAGIGFLFGAGNRPSRTELSPPEDDRAAAAGHSVGHPQVPAGEPGGGR